MGLINVEYQNVQGATSNLAARLVSELDQVMQRQNEITAAITNNTDGGANAEMINLMEARGKRDLAIAATIKKLISFVSNSTIKIEATEGKVADAIKKS